METGSVEWRIAATPSAEYTLGGQWAGDRRTTDTALDETANQLAELRAGGRWTGAANLWEARAYARRQDQALRRAVLGSSPSARPTANCTAAVIWKSRGRAVSAATAAPAAG